MGVKGKEVVEVLGVRGRKDNSSYISSCVLPGTKESD